MHDVAAMRHALRVNYFMFSSFYYKFYVQNIWYRQRNKVCAAYFCATIRKSAFHPFFWALHIEWSTLILRNMYFSGCNENKTKREREKKREGSLSISSLSLYLSRFYFLLSWKIVSHAPQQMSNQMKMIKFTYLITEKQRKVSLKFKAIVMTSQFSSYRA